MTLIDQEVGAWLERLHLATLQPARSRAPPLGRDESSHSVELGLIPIRAARTWRAKEPAGRSGLGLAWAIRRGHEEIARLLS
jgi:hypothetical protein